MYNLCVIDDRIPVNGEIDIADNYPLSYPVLKLLLEKQRNWDDPEVKKLIEDICKKPEQWRVYAFTDPNIYLNAVQNDGYSPNIIIYDWEYPTVDNPGEILNEILETTYAVVYIFTGGDHKAVIEATLAKEPLKKYCANRLYLLMKNEADAPQKLLLQAEEAYKANFSFRFGRELRQAAYKALEAVLITFGQYNLNMISLMLRDETGEEVATNETDLKMALSQEIANKIVEDGHLLQLLVTEAKLSGQNAHNVIHLLTGKIFEHINTTRISVSHEEVASTGSVTTAPIDLWSSRLYYQPSDSTVRNGDIVRNGNNQYFLVCSADCDLARFWNKNMGTINLIPLFHIQSDATQIKGLFELTNTPTQAISKICALDTKSIIGQSPAGSFILPFVKFPDQSTDNLFMGFPKRIISYPVQAPNLAQGEPITNRRDISLDYTMWIGYERVSTISEPFLTPLIQHCLASIAGYGTLSYPDKIGQAIKQQISTSFRPPST